MAKRLNRHALDTGTIPNEQFGFCKRHSTTSQLTRLTEYITHGDNIEKHTGLITLDLEKAYDSVWIQGLLVKLITLKISTLPDILPFLVPQKSVVLGRPYRHFLPHKIPQGRPSTRSSTITDLIHYLHGRLPTNPSYTHGALRR